VKYEDVQRVIDYFKSWLPAVTERYGSILAQDRQRAEDTQRAALRAEQQELERQKRLRAMIRL
jgi:hypothetical protein